MVTKKKVRYAVVGLGHIAQVAVLPGFKHAKNSEVAALVSGDAKKLTELSERFDVERTYSYEQYERCLQSGDVDAVYIALPNEMHCDYSVRASRAGVHVLCEKPLAVTEEECRQMIDAASDRGTKLMTAYRLHFEEANLNSIEIVNSGQIGRPRLFDSFFAMQVREENIRTKREHGGGTLYDIGIYCINAARYLFRAEPTEVIAASAADKTDPRFAEIDEATAAILRFPEERLATFVVSFGVADVSTYRIACTKGDLRLEPAYSYAEKLVQFVTTAGQTKRTSFRKRDQFGAQIAYFSDCILQDRDPEPSGEEGLADVRIIRALYRSAAEGRPIRLEAFSRDQRPSIEQEVHKPPVSKPEPVHAEAPHY